MATVSLFEKYGKQIKVAENFVLENFGKKISDRTKLNTAVLIENTNKFITMRESLSTNRSDLGDYKKFCLNLTNIAVPSLIANDLVIVHAMTSFSGSVAYLEYVAKTDKNGMQGKVLNSVFGLGAMDDARKQYTTQFIVDTIVGGQFAVTADEIFPNGVTYTDRNNVMTADIKYILSNGVVKYGAFADLATIATGEKNADNTPATVVKALYAVKTYQMAQVPAQDIPTVGPQMKNIPLVAEPRRIAVRYDQITAFQAKTDYGFSLDKQIAEQAVGELNYEIDTEIVDMLFDAAKENTSPEEFELLTFHKTLPLGVDMFRHYSSFLNTLSKARTIIYKRTKKFLPNYMVCAPDVLNVLEFVNGYKDTTPSKIYGPYKAGELNGLKIYVSPKLDDGEYFIGLNGSDMVSSAGVYAPYMAIVPTQLLGTPDGGLQQGFSTWYATAIVNGSLLVHGKIED